jgi:hypothetical protein
MPYAAAGELITFKRQGAPNDHAERHRGAALGDMEEKDIGFPAGSGRQDAGGVVSERDIARGVILHRRTLVREIMTTRVHTVAPEAKVPECLMLMHRERIRHLPVRERRSRAGRALGSRPDGIAHRASRAATAQAARRAPDDALPLLEQLLRTRP